MVSQDLQPAHLAIKSMNLPLSLYILEVPFPLDCVEQETITLSTGAVGLQNGGSQNLRTKVRVVVLTQIIEGF